MNRYQIAERLTAGNACEDGAGWMETYNGEGEIDVNKAWADCPRGDWLLWACVEAAQGAYRRENGEWSTRSLINDEQAVCLRAAAECARRQLAWALDNGMLKDAELLDLVTTALNSVVNYADLRTEEARREAEDAQFRLNEFLYPDGVVNNDIPSRDFGVALDFRGLARDAAGDWDVWYFCNGAAGERIPVMVDANPGMERVEARATARRQMADAVRFVIPTPPDWVLRHFGLDAQEATPTSAGSPFGVGAGPDTTEG
jgi:hypothetical protein